MQVMGLPFAGYGACRDGKGGFPLAAASCTAPFSGRCVCCNSFLREPENVNVFTFVNIGARLKGQERVSGKGGRGPGRRSGACPWLRIDSMAAVVEGRTWGAGAGRSPQILFGGRKQKEDDTPVREYHPL